MDSREKLADENNPNYARIEPYDQPVGGWGALLSVARNLKRQETFKKGSISLLNINHRPDSTVRAVHGQKKDTQTFNFCENGAKAVAFEATKRVTPEFFATHTVSGYLNKVISFWKTLGALPTRCDTMPQQTNMYQSLGMMRFN